MYGRLILHGRAGHTLSHPHALLLIVVLMEWDRVGTRHHGSDHLLVLHVTLTLIITIGLMTNTSPKTQILMAIIASVA